MLIDFTELWRAILLLALEYRQFNAGSNFTNTYIQGIIAGFLWSWYGHIDLVLE